MMAVLAIVGVLCAFGAGFYVGSDMATTVAARAINTMMQERRLFVDTIRAATPWVPPDAQKHFRDFIDETTKDVS